MFGDGSDECDCPWFSQPFYTRRCTRRPPARTYETSHSFLTNLFLNIPIISTAFVTGVVLVFWCFMTACLSWNIVNHVPRAEAEPSVGLNWLLGKFGLVLSIKTCLLKQEYPKPCRVNDWTRVSLTQNACPWHQLVPVWCCIHTEVVRWWDSP